MTAEMRRALAEVGVVIQPKPPAGIPQAPVWKPTHPGEEPPF